MPKLITVMSSEGDDTICQVVTLKNEKSVMYQSIMYFPDRGCVCTRCTLYAYATDTWWLPAIVRGYYSDVGVRLGLLGLTWLGLGLAGTVAGIVDSCYIHCGTKKNVAVHLTL